MKQKFLHLATILACLILTFGILPLTASAASVDPGEYYTDESVVYINSESSGVVVESGVKNDTQSNQQAASGGFDITKYVSVKEATNILREQMKNRVTNISLYVVDYTSDVWQTRDDIFYGSFEHTGDPKGGDYLERIWERASTSSGYYYVNGVYYRSYDFTIEYKTTAAQEVQMDLAVRSLLDQLNVYQASDYNKVAAIYDWICSNVTYDYDNLYDDNHLLKYTAYAALINRTAVCQGYASLFYRLALELGVDTRYIGGYANGGSHGWNIVKLDGLYYNLDSTWDSEYKQAGYSYQYFLKCMNNFPDHQRREEFATAEFNAQYPMDVMDYHQATATVASGIFGNGLTWKINAKGTLTISGTGAMPWYSDVSQTPWYNYRYSVTSVVIESGVQSIANFAFCNCLYMTKISIAETVTSIGTGAFTNCVYLSQITFLGNPPAISDNAFMNVSATVTYPGLRSAWSSVVGKSYGGNLRWSPKIDVNDGWIKSDGYYYLIRNGVKQTGWQKVGNYWYYMDSFGIMQTGWVKVGSNWYHMSASGSMQTGWLKIGTNWFYLNSAGAMQTGWVQVGSNWYYMASGGAMQTGWVKVGSNWYYMNSSGVMQRGWLNLSGKWYHLGSGGIMDTGLTLINGKYYYFSQGGLMLTGTQTINGVKHLFGSDGAAITGWYKASGLWYYRDATGAMAKGWVKDNGNWYYLNSAGAMQTGWEKVNGNWYYLDSAGVMQIGWEKINGSWYYLDSAGVMQTGWVKSGGSWYYLDSAGVMQIGWEKVNGSWYYLDGNGVMVTGTRTIGGKRYTFNASGVLVA